MKLEQRSTTIQGKEPRGVQAQPATPYTGVNHQPPAPSPTSDPDVRPEPAAYLPQHDHPGNSDRGTLRTKLTNLAVQKQNIAEEEARLRRSGFDLNKDVIAEAIASTIELGFDLETIAKPHGLTVAKPTKSGKSSQTKNKRGPCTYDGWVTIFTDAGIRGYTKKHRVIAEEIPADELSKIRENARTKAAGKCPPHTSPEQEQPK